MSFGVVDAGPGRAVDDHRGPEPAQRRAYGRRVGDVERPAAISVRLLTGTFKQRDEVSAEHSRGPRDEPSAHPACPPWPGSVPVAPDPETPLPPRSAHLSGSHQSRLSRYHCTV